MYNWQNIQKRIAGIKNPIGAEIGVYQGVMSERLLANIPDLTLYMIDLWSPVTDDPDENIKEKYFDNWKENFRLVLKVWEEFQTRSYIYKMPSLEAVKKFEDNYFDFVYIDADHRYEAVKADIIAWLPKVRAGGFLCGHDYGEKDGVTKAVDELFPDAEKDTDYTWFVRV